MVCWARGVPASSRRDGRAQKMEARTMDLNRHTGRRDLCRTRGFTLLELLVVIAIISVVLALLLPAIGGARNVARNATTQTLMRGFGDAVDKFRQDNDGRTPGVFTARQMGHQDNENLGFTAMENVLLDLAGGVVTPDSRDATIHYAFGPSNDAIQENQRYGPAGRFVRPDFIGSDGPGYFIPPSKYFVEQERGPDGSHFQQSASSANQAPIPAFVDAWGTPMLLWVEDEFGPRDIRNIDDFARRNASGGSSRFYWASNAGFLRSLALGDRGRNQTWAASGSTAPSLIGDGAPTSSIPVTMTGFLGNPSYPGEFNGVNTLPNAARGRIVIQSAGTDGIILAASDSGAINSGASQRSGGGNYTIAGGGLRYGRNFFTGDGARLERNGSPATEDVADRFNDLFQSFGN